MLLRVPLDRVRRSSEQPRAAFDDAELDSLADSIREHGLLQPLLVREQAGEYVLVAGERRWRACGRAGLTEIPVLVTDRAEQDQDALLMALVENLQRADLNPVEEAEGYRLLMESCRADPAMAPSLLLIEKLPDLVAEQVKAVQNLKIDKITVWDGGRNGSSGSKGATADFLSGLMGSLPAMHELAQQAGIQLPGVLGKVDEMRDNGVEAELAVQDADVVHAAPRDPESDGAGRTS